MGLPFTCIFCGQRCLSVVLQNGHPHTWGLAVYRKAVPFFLGLVLGDFMLGGFWSIMSILLNRPCIRWMPGYDRHNLPCIVLSTM